MNQFQTDVMNYLASADTTDRREAMIIFINRGFFRPTLSVEDSKRLARQILVSNTSRFCNAGIKRFEQALDLVPELVTIEVRALMDIQPSSEAARAALLNARVPSRDVDSLGEFLFSGLEGEEFSFGPGGNQSGMLDNYSILEIGAPAGRGVQGISKTAAEKAVAKKVPATKKAVKRAPAKKVAAKKVAKKAVVKKAPVRVRGW